MSLEFNCLLNIGPDSRRIKKMDMIVLKDELMYFKNNVQVEPLINNCFTWYNIIPPVSTALNIVERFLPIMQSYIEDPGHHADCVKNPVMNGGAFIDLGDDRSVVIAELLEKIKKRAAPIFASVKAIRTLAALLKEKAVGFKLEELYAQIPEELKGYVELYFDRHHRPDFRFFETLIYKRPYYLESLQSIAFSLITGDTDRPFISTPRIQDGNVIILEILFRSDVLDTLFKMKSVPGNSIIGAEIKYSN
jgi:hypothetical protein